MTRRRTRRENRRTVHKCQIALYIAVSLGILYGLVLCVTQPRTGRNLAIEQQEKRIEELLTEAYHRCPKGTEELYTLRSIERRMDERIKQLEDKLSESMSMNPNMGLWEIQSISLEVKSIVDEAEKSLQKAGCISG